MTQQVVTSAVVREVTEDEVAFYQENGWAKLDQLVSSETAGEMLAQVQRHMEEAPVAERGKAKIYDIDIWRDWHWVARDEQLEPFRSVAFSKVLGRNARHFMGREVSVRYHADLMLVKMPAGHGASKPTQFHQDFPNFPFDRAGMLSVWIALDEVPPERGALRFVSGSHREGPLGRVGLQGEDMLDYYPRLQERYELSPPLHLQPGDATVHSGLVVHGAPENKTDKPRWAWVTSCYPADALFTGAPHHIFRAELGLEVGQPIVHDNFPVIYP